MAIKTIEERAHKARRNYRAIGAGGLVILISGLADMMTGDPQSVQLFTLVAMAAFYLFLSRGLRRQAEAYDVLAAELRTGPFHRLDFDRAEEASAFVAALARKLHSPRTDMPDQRDMVEVSALQGPNGVSVYLSDAALEATTNAFAEPPKTTGIDADQLPAGRVVLLAGTVDKPLGLDDVQRRLAPT